MKSFEIIIKKIEKFFFSVFFMISARAIEDRRKKYYLRCDVFNLFSINFDML